MKARYAAEEKDEKNGVKDALKRLVPKTAGSVESRGGKISTIIKAGEITLTVTAEREGLLKRKQLLRAIETRIDREAVSVLEIGFLDGIISKNLNCFGYEVTAVDPANKNVLNVIAREWHDNLLGAGQDVAKFYSEPINLKWLKKIPDFEVVIAVNSNNTKTFQACKKTHTQILEVLLNKTERQLFMRVTEEGSADEFPKAALFSLAKENGWEADVVFKEGAAEICLINKIPGSKPLRIVHAGETRNNKSTIFEVELAKCLDLYGAGYANDKHHFTGTLKQYQRDPQLKYEDSLLKRYYDYF
ncbi:MAG: hypothetical protein GX335_09480 [Firmicutes bacterium]|nr:hypothetical protein [Bacillota bacterium]